MCAAAMNFWVERGYYDEGRRWIEQALSHAGNHDSVELGQCLHALSHLRKVQGDTRGAHDVALQTVALWRRLQDKDRLAHILSLVAWLNRSLGDSISARQAATEVVALSRETGDMTRLAIGLWHLAGVEADEGDCTRSLELLEVAIHIHEKQHEELLVIDALYTKACILRRMGRSREAYEQMRDLIPDYVRLSSPEMLVTTAEDFGAILADLGDRQHAIRLLGSAEAMRERIGAPREPVQQAEIAEPYTELRSDMTASDWEREYQRGRSMLVEDALMASLASP
jgi:tetratricopeptide (TPR) repeat protein